MKKHKGSAMLIFMAMTAMLTLLPATCLAMHDMIAINSFYSEDAPSQNDETDTNEKSAAGDGCYLTKNANGTVTLTNRVDGYSIIIPGSSAVDTSLSPIRTAVTFGNARLYIYAEDTSDTSQDNYIYYSNENISDDRDIKVIESGETVIRGLDAAYKRWVRRPLSRVRNDLNNYACFDIKYEDSMVYTLMFKYGNDVRFDRDIFPVVNSFRPVIPDAEPDEIRVGSGPGPELSPQAKEAYDRLFSPDAPLTWGLFVNYPDDPERLNALEEQIGHEFEIYLHYTSFFPMEDGWPSLMNIRLLDALNVTCPPGKIPELTFQTRYYNDDIDGLMIYDVLDGQYDYFIHSYASDVAAFGRPVLMRLGNEMNGDWCSYNAYETCRDPDIYVEFYRYVFDIFRQEGADNAIWVFNPNWISFPDFKWNNELLYYPGDEYVNVVGMTAYNTGTYYPDEYWYTFDELYHDLYGAYLARYDRPLMITEFSCSGIGGNKAEWIEDMFRRIPDYNMIKVAVWWSCYDLDETDPDNPVISRSYMIDENEGTVEAFRRGMEAYKNEPQQKSLSNTD